MANIRVPKHIEDMCTQCAHEVYLGDPPTEPYTLAVKELLIGTAVQESDRFRARRQYGFDYISLRGAWGLWQMEIGAATDAIKYLNKNPRMRDRAIRFITQGVAADIRIFSEMQAMTLMHMISLNDRLACALARVNYWQKKGRIPATPEGHAKYWKKYHNTSAGKGTTEEYLDKWYRLEFDHDS